MEHKCPICHQPLVQDKNNAGKLLCYNCKNRYDKTDIMRIEGENRATSTKTQQQHQPSQSPQSQQAGYVNTTYTKTITDNNGEQHSETYNVAQQYNNNAPQMQPPYPYQQYTQQQYTNNGMPQNTIPNNNFPMQNFQQMSQAPVKKKSGAKIAIIVILVVLLVFGALTYITSKAVSNIATNTTSPASDVVGALDDEIKPLTDEQITINGKALTIGESTVNDLISAGIFEDAYVYDYDIDNNKDVKSILSNAISGNTAQTPIAEVNVKAGESGSCTINTQDNNTFVSIRYKNTGEEDKKATDCVLTTLNVFTLSSFISDSQTFDDRFVFPNGVKLGNSRDDVIKAYGEPKGYSDDSYSNSNDSDTKYLHYRLGTSVSKDVTLEKDKVTSFSISDWRYEF